jgi:hypothetical protein
VIEQGLAEGIAQRIGADVELHLYQRLVAAAVISATRVTIEHWLRTESDLPFPAVLRDLTIAQHSPPNHLVTGECEQVRLLVHPAQRPRLAASGCGSRMGAAIRRQMRSDTVRPKRRPTRSPRSASPAC